MGTDRTIRRRVARKKKGQAAHAQIAALTADVAALREALVGIATCPSTLTVDDLRLYAAGALALTPGGAHAAHPVA